MVAPLYLLVATAALYLAYLDLRYGAAKHTLRVRMKEDPIRELFLFVWIGSILTFVWALAVPSVGAIPVAASFGLPLQLWHAAGLVALLGILRR